VVLVVRAIVLTCGTLVLRCGTALLTRLVFMALERLPEDFRRVIEMLEAKKFPVEDAVGTIVPMRETPQILQAWSENPVKFSKIMVELD
jgi:threonine dehydrogenase-like Zn-dependent dehydrogenase